MKKPERANSEKAPAKVPWFALVTYGAFLFFVYAWLSVLEDEYGALGRVRIPLAALLYAICLFRLLDRGDLTVFFKSNAVKAVGCYLAFELLSGIVWGETDYLLGLLKSDLTLVSIAFWTWCIFSDRNLLARLPAVLVVVVLCAAVVSFKGFMAGGAGGRLQAGVGERLHDPNDTAYVFCWAIAILLASIRERHPIWMRLRLAASVVFLLVTVLFTGSRAGLVIVVFLAVAFVWRLRVQIAARAAVLLIPLLLWLWIAQAESFVATLPQQIQRAFLVLKIRSVSDYKEDGSMMSRIPAQAAALRMWLHNPVFGAGAGKFIEQSGLYMKNPGEYYEIAAHNSYLQVLAELGLIGFCCFMWWLFTLYRALAHPQFGTLNWIILVAVIAGFASNLVPGWHVMFVATGAAARIEALCGQPAPMRLRPRARRWRLRRAAGIGSAGTLAGTIQNKARI